MSVKFDDNYYFSLVQKQDKFSNQEKMIQSAKDKLQFRFVKITFENYQNVSQYQDELGKSAFQTFKKCAYLLIVDVISHLAKALFLGIPKAFSDKGKYLKAHLFFVIRDFQEIYGRIMAHYKGLYGQYLVQESRFHKTCYEVFLTNAERTKASGSKSRKKTESNHGANGNSRSFGASTKYGVWVDSEAKNVSLFDYKNKDEKGRKGLVQRFMTNDFFTRAGLSVPPVDATLVSNIGQSGKTLDEFISTCDSELLKQITFEDLIIPLQYSALKYAVMDVEQFNALTIQNLEDTKRLTRDQWMFIKKRAEKIHKETNSHDIPVFDFDNFNQTLLKDIFILKPEDIVKNHQKISSFAFGLFLNAQLDGVKLVNLNENQNKALFGYLSESDKKERLALFEQQDVLDAAEAGVIDGKLLKLLDSEFIKSLTLSKLSTAMIEGMFCTEYHKDRIQADKDRFANFDPDDVKLAIEQGKLTTEYQFSLLSKKQRDKIRLSELSSDTIKKWFYTKYKEKDKQADKDLFADFNPSDVKLAMEQGKLTTQYQFNLLSKEQRREIRLSELSAETIKDWFYTKYREKAKADKVQFADFDKDDVARAIELGKITTDYQKSLLSESQKAAIPLTNRSKDEVKKMDKAAIAKQTTSEETKIAFEKGTIGVDQIPTNHLKAWDFATLSRGTVKKLLPTSSVDELREKHSFTGSSYTKLNGKVIEEKSGKQCLYSEKELLKMAKLQQEKNDNLLKKLNDKQRADIAAKLAAV